MRNYIEKLLKESVKKVLKKHSMDENAVPPVAVEPPKNHDLGDYTSSIAFSLSKLLRVSPVNAGKMVIESIEDSENMLEKIEVVSGYINFFFKPELYSQEIRKISFEGDKYLKLDYGKGKRILLEFVSANPTGPLHVGHGRGAVFGDALSRILRQAGFSVVNEYYINDAGNQVMSLGKSIFSEYSKNFGIERESGEYKGEYITQIAGEVSTLEGDRLLKVSEDQALAYFISFGVKKILDNIKEDLKKLNIFMDSWVSEKELFDTGKVEKILSILKNNGYTYEGEGALWFKSSSFGDDKDRVLIKADGEKTYFASDIAYHNEKFLRKFDNYINIWGADHHGYLPRLKSALKALGHDSEKLKVLFVQMVRLTRDGKPVQMSKRAGEYITLRELVDEVGTDATRFFFLMREIDSSLNFEIELAKKQTSENPVYYVQYAHARISSIFREAGARGIQLTSPEKADLSLLSLPEEIRIIRMLFHFKDEIERSARTFSVHNITYFLIELANEFHKYYNNYRVLDETRDLREARLVFLNAIRVVLGTGLNLLGVSAPEKM